MKRLKKSVTYLRMPLLDNSFRCSTLYVSFRWSGFKRNWRELLQMFFKKKARDSLIRIQLTMKKMINFLNPMNSSPIKMVHSLKKCLKTFTYHSSLLCYFTRTVSRGFGRSCSCERFTRNGRCRFFIIMVLS